MPHTVSILLVVFGVLALVVLLNFRIAFLLRESGKKYDFTSIERMTLIAALISLLAAIYAAVAVDAESVRHRITDIGGG